MVGFLVRFPFNFYPTKWILKTFFQVPCCGQSLERFVSLLYHILITFNFFIQPTGTSTKFVNMTERALHHFEDKHGVTLEKITKIPLEGDGTIDKRVERYAFSIVL
jgi:hypothetical protein